MKPFLSIGGSAIYEVNVRQYTEAGTLKAFQLHLGRLKEMGIGILWFMPLTPISLKGRKGTLGSYYAASDYYSINPEFGTITDFKDLVIEAHRLGLKVMIDWVANHTGWDHTWTRSNPDFFIKNHAGQFCERNGWEDVIDLNYQNHEMRLSMIEAMKWWIETFGIDGFRCDMAMLVPLDFWDQARTTLDKVKPMIWLAECEDPTYLQVFDMMYGWEWMHLTKEVYRHQSGKYPLQDLYWRYIHRIHLNRNLLFTSNHDENSWNGTEYERYGDCAKAYAVLSILLPGGLPLIYSGQELPTYHRLKFFDKDLIHWDTSIPVLNDFYLTLLQFRNSNKWLSDFGSPVIHFDLIKNPQILGFHVGKLNDQDYMVMVNLSHEAQSFQIENLSEGIYENIFTKEKINLMYERHGILEPFGYRIYSSDFK